MGRRALRRTDASFELSRNLRSFEELPNPWNATALFGRHAPLEIEVGSGKGLFLRSAAKVRPEVDFLGVEIAARYARFAAAALAKQGITNAVILHGDAVRLFDEVLPDGSLAAVHVYFPDPWWKKRHKKRRVMREPFVRRIEQTLRSGGSLHFWTDVEEYFHASLELLAAVTELEGPMERARNARRARPRLPNPFRASHAAARRAGLSRGVSQTSVGAALRGGPGGTPRRAFPTGLARR